VLSYGDCLLRTRDVALLKSPNWLNDALIGFAFEFLFNQLSHDLRSSVCMIAPEVTQFIKLSASGDEEGGLPLEIFLEPLKLEEKDFVFLAINDQDDSESAGGNHWSLLVFSRSNNAFVHFDSASYNRSDADRVAKKVAPFVKCSSSPRFVESSRAAKQRNGFDCGMFLIRHAEVILDCIRTGNCDLSNINLIDPVNRPDMNSNRGKWKDRILELAKS